MNFLLPSFARYTAAKQNMRTNGLVYHMLTLLQKQADKSSRVYSNYLRVRLGASLNEKAGYKKGPPRAKVISNGDNI